MVVINTLAGAIHIVTRLITLATSTKVLSIEYHHIYPNNPKPYTPQTLNPLTP